jgi:Zn-dependent peptidase ImmA (M78 family)
MRADKAREAAAELLLRQRLRSLFLDITKLRYDRPLLFRSYRDFCRETNMTLADLTANGRLPDGFTLKPAQDDTAPCVILYNERQQNPRRRNFTLAHEIGHIYLDHRDDSDKNEAEANRFASELLMPEALLREMASGAGRPLTAEDVLDTFALSRQAANLRLQKLAIAASPTPQDREILRRFALLLPNFDGPEVSL